MRARTLGWVLVALLPLALVAALTFLGWEIALGPKRHAPVERTFAVSDARIARGRYLANGPAACVLCHSERDFADPTYPILPSKQGAGGNVRPEPFGVVPARNITPDRVVGIGNWSDGEIARAIREGVRRDGLALFPAMPYAEFSVLDDDDVESVVVYLRTLAPVSATIPARTLTFPSNLLVNTFPTPLPGPVVPHASATAEDRGRYLATIAGCQGCHTPRTRRGAPIAHLSYGGGGIFRDPGHDGKHIVSPNITRDVSGIASYDEPMFLKTMKTGRRGGVLLSHVMPFGAYRNMTDDDLRDVWSFLRAQRPVVHRVDNVTPATMCEVCDQMHGLGDRNILQR